MRMRCNSKARGRLMEVLESRQLLSGSPQFNYTDFSSTTGLDTNGFASAPVTSNNLLEMTDGGLTEARSVFFGTKVPIDTFTSHFSFQASPGTGASTDGNTGPTEADGITLVIDNGSTTDLGTDGLNLGYAAGSFGAQSVALEFNLFNLDQFGSTFAFAQGADATPTRNNVAPIDFHSGDTIDATVTYDGTNLTISLVDASNNADTYTNSEAIDLSTVLGGHTAFVGFTGATGADDSIQQVNNWDFTGAFATPPAPTITTVAASSPVIVTGTKAHLSVTASSNDSGTLSYNWTLLHKPSGAPTPTFTANNSASANETIPHFFKSGTYIFRATVTDSGGGTAISDVAVVVRQTATQIKIKPHAVKIVTGASEQYSAAMYDQFGRSFYVQPTFTYAVVSGRGAIGATSGLYTAGQTAGHLLVSASADDLTGEAGATVIT